MEKLKHIIETIIFSLILILLSGGLMIGGTFVFSYAEIERMREHNSGIVGYPDIIRFDKNIEEYTKQYAFMELYSIPIGYFDMLYGWEIVITDKDIATLMIEKGYKTEYPANSVNRYSGICVYKEKTIYINSEKSNIKQAMAHEIGHALEINLDKPSITEKFDEIYKKERHRLFYQSNEKYYTTTNREYWAESYKLYITEQEKLKSLAPETYEYLFNVLIERQIREL